MRVITSPVAEHRLEATIAFLGQFPASVERYVIGATRDAADDLARRVTQVHRATLGLHRVGFQELVAKLALGTVAADGVALATALGVQAVAARVIADSQEAGELPYLAPIASRPGFLRAIQHTLRDIRMADLTLDCLRSASQVGADLARLMERYESALSHSGTADSVSLLRRACDALEQAQPTRIDNRPLVLLDVAIHSRLERRLFEALVSRAGPLLLTVAPGDERTLDALGPNAAVDVVGNTPASNRAPDLVRVQHWLFNESAPTESAAREPGGHVELFSAPGEGRETVEIARRVLREAENGIPFDRMAIVLRAPGVYAPLVETALSRAGIPAWFSHGTHRPDPSGRAFLVLLACAAEGLSARRFAEYLAFGQTPTAAADRKTWSKPEDDLALLGTPDAHDEPATDESGVASPAPWRWERLLNDAAVLGGAARWRRRLDALGAELSLRLEELEREEPDGPPSAAVRRDLSHLDHLREFALPIVSELESWPRLAQWGEWLDCLERLAGRVLSAPDRVASILASLRPMERVGPVGLDEVIAVLHERIASVAPRPPRSRYGRVLVCTPDALRGRTFDVVFVAGLSERVFPERLRQDPLLLDRVRAELNTRWNAGLTTRGEGVAQERLRLRLAVGAATTRLYLSFTTVDASSTRERLPSLYALDLHRALTGILPDHERLARLAAATSGARLAWPAPPDPDTAVDAIEHDLATLQRLLRDRRPGARLGRARYLLEVHPALGRSLRSRYLRGRPAWTRHDGVCFDKDEQQLLAAHRLRERPYSVSSLQRFAACPYQFYLAGIMRLSARPRAEAIHRIDPLTRGRLVHETLAACVRELRDDGCAFDGHDELQRATATLERVLDAIASRYHDALAPVVERLWRDEIDSLRADLHGWLALVARTDRTWSPIHVELGFGFGPRAGRDAGSRSQPVEIEGGWRLHGVIDLLEQHGINGRLRVTDYKTARTPVAPDTVVGGGTVLQPVLYALAAEALLGRPVHESRLFYCTSPARYVARTVALAPDAGGSRAAGQEVLQIIDRSIELGFLPPAPREGACQTCEFLAVCGPMEARRAARKDRRRLQDLDYLRTMR
ncbi:MAG: PD-(D/E)XK nuclease family protein [Vicinamibacterales bacterium]